MTRIVISKINVRQNETISLPKTTSHAPHRAAMNHTATPLLMVRVLDNQTWALKGNTIAM